MQPHIVPMPPTAWQSVPPFVRVAVWVWAIGIIVSLALAIVAGLLFFSAITAALGGAS